MLIPTKSVKRGQQFSSLMAHFSPSQSPEASARHPLLVTPHIFKRDTSELCLAFVSKPLAPLCSVLVQPPCPLSLPFLTSCPFLLIVSSSNYPSKPSPVSFPCEPFLVPSPQEEVASPCRSLSRGAYATISLGAYVISLFFLYYTGHISTVNI